VEGYDIIERPVEVRHRVGYLAENAPAYDEMTPEAFLKFVCDARGIGGKERNVAIEKAVDACAIGEVLHQPIGTLSKGFRRRVGLTQALVHDPPALILDEPTDGLDPNQKHDVRELITELAPEKAIVVSTHILEEVEAICNRIIIIDHGRLLVDSTPQQLREKEGGSLAQVFRQLTTGSGSERKGGVA
jgi:ABC-2 type transport system ATP-binding protein